MTSMKAFIERRPVAIYFALTFVISWGGVVGVVGLAGAPGTKEQFAKLFPIALLAMLAGPSVAGILLTSLVSGRAGLRELLSRMLRWRVGARWYAVALLTAPLVLTATLLALSLGSSVFLPGIVASDDKASRLLFGLAAGLVTGFLEELGWTGFAVPRLRPRHGVLATGLIVGSLWGAWHFLPNVWGSAVYTGGSSRAVYLSATLAGLLIGQLPAFRVLMVWVYDRTGSLLVAMVMHVSLTACTLILEPLAISGASLFTYGLASDVAMWAVVAAVAAANGWQFSRQPLVEGGLALAGRTR